MLDKLDKYNDSSHIAGWSICYQISLPFESSSTCLRSLQPTACALHRGYTNTMSAFTWTIRLLLPLSNLLKSPD